MILGCAACERALILSCVYWVHCIREYDKILIHEEQSVYLAYYPIANQLTECTKENAVNLQPTYRKAELVNTSPANFSFRYLPDEL
jgi:methionyl-tRNA synthetase